MVAVALQFFRTIEHATHIICRPTAQIASACIGIAQLSGLGKVGHQAAEHIAVHSVAHLLGFLSVALARLHRIEQRLVGSQLRCTQTVGLAIRDIFGRARVSP